MNGMLVVNEACPKCGEPVYDDEWILEKDQIIHWACREKEQEGRK